MNKRIKQLMIQADYPAPELASRAHRLAELIVQECIDALWTEECYISDLAVEDYNRNCRKIKQHFGVK